MRVGEQVELCENINKKELETFVTELNRDLAEKMIKEVKI